MIELQDLSKGFYFQGEYVPVLEGLTLRLPTGRSLALLGGNGAGKSTLLSLIAGTLMPDRGHVIRHGAVSWPVGQANSIHKELTGMQNTRFLARVYGVDSDELVDFVQDFAEIGKHFDMPVRTYSSGMRARLTFGIAMGIPFETYLLDEVTSVGDARFKRKSRAFFRDRISAASAIMVNHSLPELNRYCDAALILHQGQIEYHEDLEAAIARHEEMMA